jgi:hypothetical protein
MLTRSVAGPTIRSTTTLSVRSIEDQTTTLDVLCQLLDAAAIQFDLADSAGDTGAAAEAIGRLRAIAAEIDNLTPCQLSDGDESRFVSRRDMTVDNSTI